MKHSGLFLSTPRNTIGTKECAETSDALPCCGATSPICITQRIKVGRALGNITKTKMLCPIQIAKSGAVKELRHFIYYKGDVGSCEDEILENPCYVVEKGNINGF